VLAPGGSPWTSTVILNLERWANAATLPGDDLIPVVKLDSTHAITIRAPAERIWPWLAQMGYGGRAGFYSYDILKRRFGARDSSRLNPEMAAPVAGDCLPFAPGTPMTVAVVDPSRALVLWQVTAAGKATRPAPGARTTWRGAGRSCSNPSMRARRGC
jgi:hypothetical protein